MADPIAIYDEVLAFSVKQVPWVQDVLRRIVVGGGPASPTDRADAVTMCKEAHGLATGAPKLVPLDKSHLPTTKGGAAPVSLVALRDLVHVNALLPAQTLGFAPLGLTGIYGGNGSGKSGYARVLKKLCRARGALSPILSDVFASATGVPTATIDYSVGVGVTSWSGQVAGLDADGPEALSHVAVYDRASGLAISTAEQPVELLPPGLDLLPLLKDVLDHVAQTLRGEDQSDTRGPGFPVLESSTVSGAFLVDLSKNTTQADLDAACAWSESDEQALVDVTARIAELQASDPKKRAAELTQRAGRLNELVQALEKAQKDLSPEVKVQVDKRRARFLAAEIAIALHRGKKLPADVLPGTGESSWRLLWDAARTFSVEQAYASLTFPRTELGDRCVLCQQILDDAARDRLQAFEAFVSDRLSTELDAASADVTSSATELREAVNPGLTSGNLLAEAKLVDNLNLDSLDVFVASAVARRDALLASLDSAQSPAVPPELSAPPLAELVAAAKVARDRATELGAVKPSEALGAARVTRDELNARKKLHDCKPLLEAEVARLRRSARRREAIAGCSTSSLSIAAGKLTEQHVTQALADAFNDELKVLGGEHLRVALAKTKTQKGTTFTRLVLQHAGGAGAVVNEVFSEGELRAVALAQFFAELALAPSKSAIVFDDPVTSLDHQWRAKVAERLALEAKSRQVVVFTHDAVFLAILIKACETAGVDHHGVHLQRQGKRPGHCSSELPWDALSVGKRIKALTNDHVELVKLRKSGTDEAYARGVTAFLDRLRKTWERSVEECLFNGVIERFDFGVSTLRLSALDFEAGDHAAVEKGMTACSAWVHDPAQPLAMPPPEPPQLAQMVNDLVAWIQVLKARRPKQSLPDVKAIKLAS